MAVPLWLLSQDPAHEQVVVIQSSPAPAQPPRSPSMRSQSLAMWKRLLGVPAEAPKGAPSPGTDERRVSVTVYKSIPLPGIKVSAIPFMLLFFPLLYC